MRFKRLIFFSLAVCASIVSAGCWDARDINDKALITLVVTDRQDGDLVFYVEVPNLTVGQLSERGASQEQYDIISGAGKTYAEARRQLDTQMDKPIFLGTVRALVLTDELMEFGIEEYFYRMQTMVDYRRALDVVTTRDTPEAFLSVQPENNVSIGYEIDETVNSLESNGKVVIYTISDVLEFLYADQCFVLINMDVKNGRLIYTGYSVIHSGKYGGFVPLEESKGLVWLLGHNTMRIYTVQTDAYLATVDVRNISRKITPHYSDGQITFDIRLGFDSRVLYMDKSIRFDDRQQALVKNMLQTQLMDDVAEAIIQSQAFQCDYLGFKDVFRTAYPGLTAQLDWDAAYTNAAFNISVETTLDPGGMLDMEVQGETVQ